MKLSLETVASLSGRGLVGTSVTPTPATVNDNAPASIGSAASIASGALSVPPAPTPTPLPTDDEEPITTPILPLTRATQRPSPYPTTQKRPLSAPPIEAEMAPHSHAQKTFMKTV
ncbi:MAG: hypothetical protein FWD73_17025 [Polyangiaceae bacterium]|nr:hypothetical protein [Polyangiaceae bacterium]